MEYHWCFIWKLLVQLVPKVLLYNIYLLVNELINECLNTYEGMKRNE